MTDKPKTNQGSNIQKPNVPDQTRGQSPTLAPPKPSMPAPLVKPKTN
jgi:hypothetical protein